MFNVEVRRLDAYLTAAMRRHIEAQDAQVSVDSLRHHLDHLLKPIRHADQIGLNFETKRVRSPFVDRVIFYVDFCHTSISIQVDQSHLPVPPPNYLAITTEIVLEF